jgi:hypothetical protein
VQILGLFCNIKSRIKALHFYKHFLIFAVAGGSSWVIS